MWRRVTHDALCAFGALDEDETRAGGVANDSVMLGTQFLFDACAEAVPPRRAPAPVAPWHRSQCKQVGRGEQCFESEQIVGGSECDHHHCIAPAGFHVAVVGAREARCQYVEQRSTSHSVGPGDRDGRAGDPSIGGSFVARVCHVGLFQPVFLHQSVGERKRRFGFGLGRVRMIRPLENGANLFDHVVKLP